MTTSLLKYFTSLCYRDSIKFTESLGRFIFPFLLLLPTFFSVPSLQVSPQPISRLPSHHSEGTPQFEGCRCRAPVNVQELQVYSHKAALKSGLGLLFSFRLSENLGSFSSDNPIFIWKIGLVWTELVFSPRFLLSQPQAAAGPGCLAEGRDTLTEEEWRSR